MIPFKTASSVVVNDNQKILVEELNQKILNFENNFYESNCLCCNNKTDVVEILDRDRYGVKVPQVLCRKCGIIRSRYFMEDKMLIDFYTKSYRSLYVGSSVPTIDFFNDQLSRGKRILSKVREVVDLKKMSVLEIGCGAGGVLKPFSEYGAIVTGLDFDLNYLNYGRNLGINLLEGGIEVLEENDKFDIIILSHVLEHFNSPEKEIQKIKKHMHEKSILVIEVPGIFNIHKAYINLTDYFQTVHTYNFHRNGLVNLLMSCQLESFYSDETVFVMCRKTNKYPSAFEGLASKAKLVYFYMILVNIFNILKINPYFLKSKLNTILRKQ